jgi:hypothetical protein
LPSVLRAIGQLDKTAPTQHVEHVAWITTGEAIDKQSIITISDAQAWMLVALSAPMQRARTMAHITVAITLAAECFDDACCIVHVGALPFEGAADNG